MPTAGKQVFSIRQLFFFGVWFVCVRGEKKGNLGDSGKGINSLLYFILHTLAGTALNGWFGPFLFLISLQPLLVLL